MPEEEELPSEAADDAATTTEDEQDFDDAFAEFSGDESPEFDEAVSEDSSDNDDGDSVAYDVEEIETTEEESNDEVEKLRQQLSESEHKFRSNDGRMAAYQRQISNLQEQLSANTAGNANEEGDPDDDADLKAFSEEYPEIAKPLEKMRQKDERRIETLEARLAAENDESRATAEEKQEAYLTDNHADWKQITAMPEFSQWVNTQPAYVLQAAERNGQKIVDGYEAAHLVESFKASLPSQEPSDEESDSSKSLAGKRKRQIESAGSVKSKGPGASSGAPQDFDAAFEYFTNKT